MLNSQGNVSYCMKLESSWVELPVPSTPVGVPPDEIPITVPSEQETYSSEAPTSMSEIVQTPSVGDNRNMTERNEEVRVNSQLSIPKEYPKRNHTRVQKYDPSFK